MTKIEIEFHLMKQKMAEYNISEEVELKMDGESFISGPYVVLSVPNTLGHKTPFLIKSTTEMMVILRNEGYLSG